MPPPPDPAAVARELEHGRGRAGGALTLLAGEGIGDPSARALKRGTEAAQDRAERRQRRRLRHRRQQFRSRSFWFSVFQ